MNAVVENVRSLWVPLSGINLLVPNVAIAEVINYQPFELSQQGPGWLLGKMRWRDQEVPVISMERLLGQDWKENQFGARISIVNSVRKSTNLPFYAMVTAGIPRLFSADADSLGNSVRAAREYTDAVADAVQIGSEEALIPNLEIIQGMVEAEWGKLV